MSGAPTNTTDNGHRGSSEPRVEARTMSVEDLVRDTRSGKLRVPRFQRELKWGQDEVRLLLESVYRQYPIGNLLFWEREASAERFQIGSVVIDARRETTAWWVIDGQQRLHALVRSLAGAGAPVESFAMSFDLDGASFEIARARQSRTGTKIPVEMLLDSNLLLQWLVEHHTKLSESQRAVAIDAGKRMREYKVPAYVVSTQEESDVREMFRRLNTTGTRMEEFEVFNALHGTFDDRDPADLRAARRELETTGFGTLNERDLYRMALAMEGLDPLATPTEEALDRSAGPMLENLVPTSLRVIAFLRDDVGVPHRELLPYSSPLYVLTAFFRRYPTPSPRSRALLARWMWRGAITGEHRSDTVRLRDALRAVRQAGDEESAVQGVLVTVSAAPRPLAAARTWSPNFAACRIEALALLSLSPRDIRDGSSLLDDSPPELPHWARHPEALLPESKANDLAGRFVHSALDDDAWSTLERASDEVLASHGVPPQARASILARDVEAFEVLRRDRLHGVVRDFIDAKAAWSPPDRDRPSIEYLVARATKAAG